MGVSKSYLQLVMYMGCTVLHSIPSRPKQPSPSKHSIQVVRIRVVRSYYDYFRIVPPPWQTALLLP